MVTLQAEQNNTIFGWKTLDGRHISCKFSKGKTEKKINEKWYSKYNEAMKRAQN